MPYFCHHPAPWRGLEKAFIPKGRMLPFISQLCERAGRGPWFSTSSPLIIDSCCFLSLSWPCENTRESTIHSFLLPFWKVWRGVALYPLCYVVCACTWVSFPGLILRGIEHQGLHPTISCLMQVLGRTRGWEVTVFLEAIGRKKARFPVVNPHLSYALGQHPLGSCLIITVISWGDNSYTDKVIASVVWASFTIPLFCFVFLSYTDLSHIHLMPSYKLSLLPYVWSIS